MALYWNVGDRIRREVLGEKRAAYGRQILVTVSQELVADYGKGYSEAALGRMIQFMEKFPDFQISATLSRKLNWSHFVELIVIDGMLYERTALSKKPADLEQAVLREMEAVIPALGAGFAFVERQKRVHVGSDDFYLDLLFYNRKLRRLVAVELKLGKFKPEFKGQMELYLRWLDKHERAEGEEAPIGLILCSEKCEEQIELLELDKSGIRVAQYMTDVLSPKALEVKLHQALVSARQRLESTKRSTSRSEDR